MTFEFPADSGEQIAFKLTTTSPTVIAGDADELVRVPWFQCTNITTNTPTLTVEIYDGTTSYYLRFALAMSAKETVLFGNSDRGFLLNKGSFLRVAAGTANEIDVVGIKLMNSFQKN
jgi:hypothetical protein